MFVLAVTVRCHSSLRAGSWKSAKQRAGTVVKVENLMESTSCHQLAGSDD
ncbi:MAG: hypothetical protein P4L49_05270 [Desulfosporosinus sp.]|nr:hypothetical protein [Desulfosporosinus sp.]